ncbi:MAG: 30S ribosomal protein S13, partial [Opitutales bacterium]|nr:30S ribosomal protein S13 [Opitutales bacterium]
MPRILGVDIPNNKKLAYSLRYIYGIGPKRADLVLQETGIDSDMRAKDLNEEQINAIMAKINELNYLVEGDLRRDLAA